MKASYIPVILLALAILLATNTYNFQALLFSQDVGFNLRMFPDPMDLFIMSDIHLDSNIYVFQKTGHFLAFGVLFLLMNQAINNSKKAIILCVSFAFSTEFLQLFFERSGRLSDVLIDSAGIYAAYRLNEYVKTQGGLAAAFQDAMRKISNVLNEDKSR
ncbi:VanZ family protein [Planococcus dechangensis]|uniref:VanZ family protein n=1 Tax=Planococcus dechangensis TaxID=1176255 RepID=A0ABV9MBX9_9BACL